MDEKFKISDYLLRGEMPDERMEARVRILCAIMDKKSGSDKREGYLRPFVTDSELMRYAASRMNGLPEAITCEQPNFEGWVELFMLADEPESTRYVMRLSSWYTHFCCVEELLTMCRLVRRHRLERLDALYNRLTYYFRTARKLCGMPSVSEPAEGIEVSFSLPDANYDRITRRIVLQAEEYLGVHADHSFVEKVLACQAKAGTAEELAALCGAGSLVTFRRTFLRLFGCPAAQWLRGKRAEEVLILLRTTDYPLPEIADRCGFANQSYLSDFCKRNLGDTPMNIRKNKSVNH